MITLERKKAWNVREKCFVFRLKVSWCDFFFVVAVAHTRRVIKFKRTQLKFTNSREKENRKKPFKGAQKKKKEMNEKFRKFNKEKKKLLKISNLICKFLYQSAHISNSLLLHLHHHLTTCPKKHLLAPHSVRAVRWFFHFWQNKRSSPNICLGDGSGCRFFKPRGRCQWADLRLKTFRVFTFAGPAEIRATT